MIRDKREKFKCQIRRKVIQDKFSQIRRQTQRQNHMEQINHSIKQTIFSYQKELGQNRIAMQDNLSAENFNQVLSDLKSCYQIIWYLNTFCHEKNCKNAMESIVETWLDNNMHLVILKAVYQIQKNTSHLTCSSVRKEIVKESLSVFSVVFRYLTKVPQGFTVSEFQHFLFISLNQIAKDDPKYIKRLLVLYIELKKLVPDLDFMLFFRKKSSSHDERWIGISDIAYVMNQIKSSKYPESDLVTLGGLVSQIFGMFLDQVQIVCNFARSIHKPLNSKDQTSQYDQATKNKILQIIQLYQEINLQKDDKKIQLKLSKFIERDCRIIFASTLHQLWEFHLKDYQNSLRAQEDLTQIISIIAQYYDLKGKINFDNFAYSKNMVEHIQMLSCPNVSSQLKSVSLLLIDKLIYFDDKFGMLWTRDNSLVDVVIANVDTCASYAGNILANLLLITDARKHVQCKINQVLISFSSEQTQLNKAIRKIIYNYFSIRNFEIKAPTDDMLVNFLFSTSMETECTQIMELECLLFHRLLQDNRNNMEFPVQKYQYWANLNLPNSTLQVVENLLTKIERYADERNFDNFQQSPYNAQI